MLTVALLLYAGQLESGNITWNPFARDVVATGDLLRLIGFLILCYASFVSVGLYDASSIRGTRDETPRAFAGLFPGVALLALHGCTVSTGPLLQVAGAVGSFFATSFIVTLGSRSALRHVHAIVRRPVAKQVLVLGNGPRAQRIDRQLSSADTCVIGFIDRARRSVPTEIERRTMGGLERLERLLMQHPVDEVVVALPIRSQYRQIQDAIRTCERLGVDVRYPADVFDWRVAQPRRDDMSLDSVALHAIGTDYRHRIRRPIELVLALVALFVLAPLFLLIAIAIKMQDGGPILFVQHRHGLHRREFPMLKFRTMVIGAEEMQTTLESRNEAIGPIFKIRRDPRITSIGAFLRRTSLDELPQLLNVLAGHMSMVGPRPLPLRDVLRFEEATALRRFSVIPGMSGLWQVSGRSDVGFAEMIALDLQYIDHWSLWLDLKILWRTVGAVLRPRGAV